MVQEEANASRQLEIEVIEENWTGKVPYLRLIDLLVDDETMKAV